MEKSLAVIEIAPDDINFKIAHELAEAGYDLILIATKSERLSENIRQLEWRYCINVEGIVCGSHDASNSQMVTQYLMSIDRSVDLYVNAKGQPLFGTNLIPIVVRPKVIANESTK